MPSGAKLITTRTISDTPWDRSLNTLRVVSLPWRMAMPRPMAQTRMPMKLASISAVTGLATALESSDSSTSEISAGGATSLAAALRARVEGNKLLATTATTAAEKVPIR
ncbi:hypothetical protein D9M73_163220 [compost metagenome]